MLTLIFLFCFGAHFLLLYLRTSEADFEWIEVLKHCGPIVALALLSWLRNRLKLIKIAFGSCMLALHFVYGLLEAVMNNPHSLLTEDGRFIVLALGRGAGETAWALCVLLVTLEYLGDRGCLEVGTRVKSLARLVLLLLILVAQTRSTFLFLLIYYFYRHRIQTKVRLSHIVTASVVLCILVAIVISIPLFSPMIQRTLALETILTGRQYIWATRWSALKSMSLQEILIGSDLSPKVNVIEELSYETADPHNLFLDIFQYFGAIGVLYIVLWYRHMIKKQPLDTTAFLRAFVVTSLVVSTIRYSMVFYANVILLLIPMTSVPSRPRVNRPNHRERCGKKSELLRV